MPKVTKIEYQERINFIIELILTGVNRRRFILQNVTDKFNVTESQIDKDLKEARSIIQEYIEIDRKSEIAEIKAKYYFLYTKNLKIQDYREARSTLDSLCKLGGLNEPDKLQMHLPESVTFKVKK